MPRKLAELVEKWLFPSKVAFASGLVLVFYLFNSARFINNLVTFVTPFVIYVIIRRFAKGKIKSETREYTIPAFFALILFFALVYFLPVDSIFIVGFLSLIIINTLHHLVRDTWKISAHAMAFAAICTVLSLADIRFAIGFLILPLVVWSRLKLKRHTFSQVVLGSVVGILIPVAVFMVINFTY